MLSLKNFVTRLDNNAATDSAGIVVRATLFGLDLTAVLLPPDMLLEERVSRMNQLWDLLGEREALVVAVTPRSHR